MLVSAFSFTVASVLLALVKIPVPFPVQDTEDGEGIDDGESEGVRRLLVDVAGGRVVS